MDKLYGINVSTSVPRRSKFFHEEPDRWKGLRIYQGDGNYRGALDQSKVYFGPYEENQDMAGQLNFFRVISENEYGLTSSQPHWARIRGMSNPSSAIE